MDNSNHHPEPAAARSPTPIPGDGSEPEPAESRVEQNEGRVASDGVEISAKAASRDASGISGADAPSGTLPAASLIELRRRIEERVHDTPEMADEVMRRIFDRGDLS